MNQVVGSWLLNSTSGAWIPQPPQISQESLILILVCRNIHLCLSWLGIEEAT